MLAVLPKVEIAPLPSQTCRHADQNKKWRTKDEILPTFDRYAEDVVLRFCPLWWHFRYDTMLLCTCWIYLQYVETLKEENREILHVFISYLIMDLRDRHTSIEKTKSLTYCTSRLFKSNKHFNAFASCCSSALVTSSSPVRTLSAVVFVVVMRKDVKYVRPFFTRKKSVRPEIHDQTLK